MSAYAVTVTGSLNIGGGAVAVSGIVPVTTAASVSVSGVPVWLNPTQQVAVSGNLRTIGQPTQASTALIVVAKDQPYVPVQIYVSSTVGGSVNTTLLFTVFTGVDLAGAGLTQYAVPAGKVLRIMNMQAVVASSAVAGGTMNIFMGAFSVSASWTQAAMATVGKLLLPMLVTAGGTSAAVNGVAWDVVGPSTVGMAFTGSTANVISGVTLNGVLF